MNKLNLSLNVDARKADVLIQTLTTIDADDNDAMSDEQSVGKTLTDLKLAMDRHAPSAFEFEGG